MTQLVIFLVSVLSVVAHDSSMGSSGPQDTALGDNMISVQFATQSDRRRITRDMPLIIFPGESTYPEEPVEEEGENYVELPEWMDADLDELSMDKISLLNNANNLQDLAALFGLTKEQQDILDKESQQKREEELGVNGLRVGMNKNVREAEFAVCKPNLEMVALEAPPNTTYLPQSCVRLLRCGGCCTSKLTSCQPTKIEVVTLKVMAVKKGVVGRRRRAVHYAFVDQVSHINCSCQCRVKENHCDRIKHRYSSAECACVCKNREEEEPCDRKSTHFWDRSLCSCKCKREPGCSTGEELSQDTCRCVLITTTSSNIIGLDSRNPDSISASLYSAEDPLPVVTAIQPTYHIELPDSLDELPDEELNVLNNITNMTDFISTFGLLVKPMALSSTSSNNHGYLELDGEWAACEVQKQVVALEGPKNVSMIWPSSVRLNHCSGACAGTSHSCTAIKTQTVMIKVLGINPQMENEARTANYYTVEQEEHISCGCSRPS